MIPSLLVLLTPSSATLRVALLRAVFERAFGRGGGGGQCVLPPCYIEGSRCLLPSLVVDIDYAAPTAAAATLTCAILVRSLR